MKITEFRKLVREEVRKGLVEATNITSKSTPAEIKSIIEKILVKLESEIDNKSKSITIGVNKKKPSEQVNLAFKDIQIVRKGFNETKKVIDLYNEVASTADLYFDRLDSDSPSLKSDATNVLKNLIDLLRKNNL